MRTRVTGAVTSGSNIQILKETQRYVLNVRVPGGIHRGRRKKRARKFMQVQTSDLKISEEYRNLTPRMSDKAFRAMKRDIELNGQDRNIIVNQHYLIIDGYHRHRVCTELHMPVKIEIVQFKDKLEEILYIYRSALLRKHYEQGQLAAIALEMEAPLSEQAKQRQLETIPKKGQKGFQPVSSPNGEHIGYTEKQLAQIAGVGQGTIQRTREVKNMAEQFPDHDIAYKGEQKTLGELYEGIRLGNAPVGAVHDALKRDLEEQKKKADAAKAVQDLKLSDKIVLLNKDSTKIEELTQIADNSVDLIITDPPYEKDDFPVFEALAKVASQKLKDGGSLVFYFGQYQLLKVVKIFSELAPDLTYWWMFAVKHEKPVGSRFHSKGITVDWKPMLWYVKGNKRLTDLTIHDHITSQTPQKSRHPWAQSRIEAAYLTENLTISEHSVVLDPFLGSGEFAIPAIKLGRYFIGIEIEKNVLDRARDYIVKETEISVSGS